MFDILLTVVGTGIIVSGVATVFKNVPSPGPKESYFHGACAGAWVVIIIVTLLM